MTDGKQYKPVLLVIIDGFGIGNKKEEDLIARTKTPHLDSLCARYPSFALDASSERIHGQEYKTGSSQIGHGVLGTGRKYTTKKVRKSIPELCAENRKKQIYITETLAYASLLWAFNGNNDMKYPNTEIVMISSPEISDYTKKPVMSAKAITKRVVKEMMKEEYDFVATTYVNPGVFAGLQDVKAFQEGIEIVDDAIGEFLPLVIATGATMVIVGSSVHAKDVTSVPCIIVNKSLDGEVHPEIDKEHPDLHSLTTKGSLLDVSATLLSLLDIEKPKTMNGRSLLSGTL